MKISSKQKFFIWYVPLVALFLGYSFYLMTLSHIPYKLGFSHLFNPQKVISISSPDIYKQNSSAVIIEIAPGQSKIARARVRNLTDHDALIDIFALDAIKRFAPEEPGFKLESRSASRDEIGTWIILPKSKLSIKRNDEEFLEFLISVPADSVTGDYAGGVAVEEADDPNEVIPEGEVKIKQRYALRVYVKVTDTPTEIMHSTWDQRLALHNKLFLTHSGIVITNLIVLLILFAMFYPKNKK